MDQILRMIHVPYISRGFTQYFTEYWIFLTRFLRNVVGPKIMFCSETETIVRTYRHNNAADIFLERLLQQCPWLLLLQ
jgi:hypothetical protein